LCLETPLWFDTGHIRFTYIYVCIDNCAYACALQPANLRLQNVCVWDMWEWNSIDTCFWENFFPICWVTLYSLKN